MHAHHRLAGDMRTPWHAHCVDGRGGLGRQLPRGGMPHCHTATLLQAALPDSCRGKPPQQQVHVGPMGRGEAALQLGRTDYISIEGGGVRVLAPGREGSTAARGRSLRESEARGRPHRDKASPRECGESGPGQLCLRSY